ncbi:MAG: inositol monophosphatase [Bryobacterales bacterium]|jgi:myo-inositol-1(or 4)-monophosphatase|nr:inositol monophosphatase [Bryobacterales bacterium]
MPSYLEIATEIAREAGALLLSYLEKRPAWEVKGEQDLVTEADRASEALVVSRLHQYFPAHSVVAEEGGGADRNSEFCWYVDPLDGTTNFAHSYPAFSVSIGLLQGDEIIAGVVYDPTRDELFSAEKGSGAYLNNRRIRVSKTAQLGESLLATGFPSRKRHEDVNVYFFHQLGVKAHGIRRSGSAAIDLSCVASGRLDGFWEFGLNAWDVAAGLLLVSEAGGQYSDMRGGKFSLNSPHLIADNSLLHQEFVSRVGDVFDGRIHTPIPGLTPGAPVRY